MLFTKFFAPLFLLFFLSACQKPKPVSALEKLADGFCECTANLAAVNREVQNQPQDSLLAPEKLDRIAAEYQNSQNCAATLVEQFGKLKAEDYQKIRPFLLKKCPDRANNNDLLRELLGE